MRMIRLIADANSDQQDRGLQGSLRIDRDTAARLGVTSQAIDEDIARLAREEILSLADRAQIRMLVSSKSGELGELTCSP